MLWTDMLFSANHAAWSLGTKCALSHELSAIDAIQDVIGHVKQRWKLPCLNPLRMQAPSMLFTCVDMADSLTRNRWRDLSAGRGQWSGSASGKRHAKKSATIG